MKLVGGILIGLALGIFGCLLYVMGVFDGVK